MIFKELYSMDMLYLQPSRIPRAGRRSAGVNIKYRLFKLNPLIFRMRSFKVPEESIGSVLGQNGSNMKAS